MANQFNILDRSNNTKLENAVTSNFENVVLGTEYVSPEQQGNVFGSTIFRRYYAIPDAAGAGDNISIPLGFTITGRVVNLTGVARFQGPGGNWQPMPFVDFGGTARNIELVASTTAITMAGGTLQDWEGGGFVWIDYTK